jgi:diaminopropionate ammonia-lyase
LPNPAFRPDAVPAPSRAAAAFHRSLPCYRPTRLHSLPAIAAEVSVGAVLVKDESDRLGLPAFKVLGASWAIEQALRAEPEPHTLVAASAGNHGRAVAHVAAQRGLACRILVSARSLPVRRQAIAAEGAEVVVVDGSYQDAVYEAEQAAAAPGCLLIADVGDSAPARSVIDGYATLFDEAAAQAEYDVILVPVGVGALAAAAARHGAAAGVAVIGVEPATAACLTASLQAGRPTRVDTPGTTMAGLDCAEVSPAAWPTLHTGIRATVTITDSQVAAAVADLAHAGLRIGESGAAPLAALRLLGPPDVDPGSRVLLIATEGPTAG